MPDTPENPNEIWVAVYHPDLEMNQAVVITQAAFDEPSVPPAGQDKHGYQSWTERGWKLTGADPHTDSDRVDRSIPKRTAAKADSKKEA